MIRILLISSLIFIFSARVSAQNESDTTDFFTGKTLLFKFNGLANLSLTQFNGGIGIKRKFRFFDNCYSRTSFDWRFSQSKSNDVYSIDNEDRGTSLVHDYLFEFRKRGTIKPYLGIGGSYNVSEHYEKTDNPFRQINTLDRSIEISGRGLIGFEYYWTENITLSAEYVGMISFIYSEYRYFYFEKSSGYTNYIPFGITRGYDISIDTISFILSVYF